MRKALLIVGALTLTVVPATAVHGFGATYFIGQRAEHEKITRASLPEFQPLTLTQLAGRTGSMGAVGAPDIPFSVQAGRPASHCDGGDWLPANIAPGYPQSRTQAQGQLDACRDFIFNRMEIAVQVAAPLAQPTADNTELDCSFGGLPIANAGSEKCKVLKAFGQAFHASQDFYSHSNWTDQHDPARPIGPKNPHGLNNRGRASYIGPLERAAFPGGLISGCYTGIGEAFRCNYGFLWLKSRVKHADLNKDTGVVSTVGAGSGPTTDRGRVSGNFANAVAAAKEDTEDKWVWFKNEVRATYGVAPGNVIICAVTHDDYRTCLEGAGVAPPPGTDEAGLPV